MRIFAIADIHSPDYFTMPGMAGRGFDLVVTLGDIGVDTLDYILFQSRGVPCVGVLGIPGILPD